MGKLFGTNGIRGIFAQDFNLEFIHDITISLANYFGEGPILVGWDGRNSSILISKVISSVLNYCGLECRLAGLVPTPCLEYATKKLGYKGGIMITASHNPPQYNGIKPVAIDGVEIPREDEQKIEDIYFNKKWKKNTKTWGETENEKRAIRVYLDGIKSHLDLPKIKSRKLTIVLDLGNGAQAVTAPLLCKELECSSIPINEEIDGSFPGRGSEPTPENLSDLSNAVIKNKADFGIAFDGDGDRSIFCDNKGNILTGDKSALLLTDFILNKKPNSTVVTCLNSGSSIEKIVAKTNSNVVRTKVGSVEVSRKMVPLQALIGFEENGGFMYGLHNEVRDGAMTLALVIDLLSSSSKTINELVELLPPSFTTKDKIKCSKEKAEALIKKLKGDYPKADITDGIKINFDPINWVMIRPSGTEPIVRIYAEGSSKEKLESIMAENLLKIKSIIG